MTSYDTKHMRLMRERDEALTRAERAEQEADTIAATQHQNIKHLTEVRATLPSLPPEQRLWLFAALAKGYCTACGEAITGTCHCENDE